MSKLTDTQAGSLRYHIQAASLRYHTQAGSLRYFMIRLSVVLAGCCFLWLAARAAGAADPAQELRRADIKALQRAIEDLTATFGDRYPHGKEFLERAADCEKQAATIESALRGGDARLVQGTSALVTKIEALRCEALLANPLLDFDKLLLVRRQEGRMGLPQNWQGNCSLPSHGYDNQIAVLSPVRGHHVPVVGGKVSTLFQPEKGAFVGDVELHFDAAKMLFSMPKPNGRWQIYELGVDGRGLRQVSTDDPADVDNYDPCYLPDGRIIFCSTRCFQGVPCVGGSDKVANLFIMDADGKNVRQLTFDQDHDWCPTVLNNGRVLYTRWEYSDTPHYFTRLLFTMNPDGTNQAAYYHSNSYWPNSTFYARPIPGHPTKVVGVISGHHGVQRMGELVVFDPALGRFEEKGAVQRIPGFGQKIEPIIRDGLVEGSWPKFLHPYPLSEKYFLVSCKPTPSSHWGIYLVDTFDNFVLLTEEPGYAMLEPVPLRKTAAPPVIPDRVDLATDQAEVHISDIYAGEGMQGVPRGTVKKLRVYEPHYAYNGMGGHINIGIDGPWDGRRIWGTVPVDSDGSASFKAPANTPLAVQPLDADGKAVAVMRSWFTAMPGEVVSCTGCHESQNRAPLGRSRLAVLRKPSEIEPWYGPPRGMSFKREVQPVLDKYCVGCHQGGQSSPPDLRVTGDSRFRNFTPSYVALQPVRPPARPGKRLSRAKADGMACRHERIGADAGEGASQRQARPRKLGPVDHLDRSERARSRHLARVRRHAAGHAAAAGNAQALRQPAGGSRGDCPNAIRRCGIEERPGGVRRPRAAAEARREAAGGQRLAVRCVRGRPSAEGGETAADAQVGTCIRLRRSNWCWFPPASSSWAAATGPMTNIRRPA